LAHRVTLIPGDGIGPEVTGAARRVLDASGAGIEWDVQEAGTGARERDGDPLPPRVIESVRERGVALKGPIATPADSRFRSPNIALREALGLHATIRPCRALPGVPVRVGDTDLVIVKMNSGDLYEGIEYRRGEPATERLRTFIGETHDRHLGDDTEISIRPLSASNTRWVVRRAFAYAAEAGRSKVTAVHKANVVRATDGMFLEIAREVSREFSSLAFEEELVDAVSEHLVRSPADYDVLVMPRVYGDIVSGIAAALIGGVGMAPGVNLGEQCAVFEAAHGSAPRHAGRNRANPMALLLSGAMLLRHLGEHEAADRFDAAIAAVLREGRTVTYDLKTSRHDPDAAGTSEVADAVIAAL
jgi:isocitrate dehydrogenase (NAD+)